MGTQITGRDRKEYETVGSGIEKNSAEKTAEEVSRLADALETTVIKLAERLQDVIRQCPPITTQSESAPDAYMAPFFDNLRNGLTRISDAEVAIRELISRLDL